MLIISILVGFSQEKQEWKLLIPESPDIIYAEISPNGKYVLLIGGNSLQIWDIKSKKLLRTLHNPGSSDNAKWSPDSKKTLFNYSTENTLNTKLFQSVIYKIFAVYRYNVLKEFTGNIGCNGWVFTNIYAVAETDYKQV